MKVGYRIGDTDWLPIQVMKYLEVEERSNEWFDDESYQGFEVVWVTHKMKDVLRYGSRHEVRRIDLSNAVLLLSDGDGGFLYGRKK